MTYCVAIRPDAGMVFLADSRTNAGVDQISTFRKLTLFEQPGDRVIVLMSAGNLSLSQAVRSVLTENVSETEGMWAASNMWEAASCVGDAVRTVFNREAVSLRQHDVAFNIDLIVGGQIGTEPCRLFHVYPAGNFIEATDETVYFQIGESKYGKPILDRVIDRHTSLDEATKCALASMDSTLRSNLSVGMPLDLIVYEANTLRVTRYARITRDSAYFRRLTRTWRERLREALSHLPNPVWADADVVQATADDAIDHEPMRAIPAGQSPAPSPRAQDLADGATPTPPGATQAG